MLLALPECGPLAPGPGQEKSAAASFGDSVAAVVSATAVATVAVLVVAKMVSMAVWHDAEVADQVAGVLAAKTVCLQAPNDSARNWTLEFLWPLAGNNKHKMCHFQHSGLFPCSFWLLHS